MGCQQPSGNSLTVVRELCTLSEFFVSFVPLWLEFFTTKAQRTQRKHDEKRTSIGDAQYSTQFPLFLFLLAMNERT